MNETEKRRMELLKQTRRLYSDGNTPPAVHPRYSATYQTIYGKTVFDNQEQEKGTLGIRIFIAMLLLGAILTGNFYEQEKTQKVVGWVQEDIQWNGDIN